MSLLTRPGFPARLSRGMTLVELLIYIALTALVMGIALSFFLSSKRLSEIEFSRLSARSSVFQTLSKLMGELQSTQPKAIMLGSWTDLQCLAFSQEASNSVESSWNPSLIQYTWSPSVKILSRSEWTASTAPATLSSLFTTSGPSLLPDAQLQSLAQAQAGQNGIHLNTWEVTKIGSDGLEVHLVAAGERVLDVRRKVTFKL